jgi:hypothetical protein
MQSSWMFYPKYGEDVVKKVLGCFVNWKDTDNKDDYTLYETELCDVIACLCKEDTRIYSPYADKVWSMKVAPYGQRDPKRESILDLLLSQDKLCL